jgi:hypothetical protein
MEGGCAGDFPQLDEAAKRLSHHRKNEVFYGYISRESKPVLLYYLRGGAAHPGDWQVLG